MNFDHPANRRAAYHHLWSAIVMFKKASMSLWGFLRLVGESWQEPGKLLND